MKNKKPTYAILVLAFLTWTLTLLAKDHPEKVEKVYSSTIYPFLAKAIGKATGPVPFAIGELLIFALIIIIFTGMGFVLIKPSTVFRNLSKISHVVIRVLGLAYVLFYFTWGFNYYRQDYMTLTNMSDKLGSVDELEKVTLEVIAKANEIRANLLEDEEGVFVLKEDFGTLSKMANEGFENYFVGTGDLSGDYGRAKPLKISKWMSYTGITGIYLPYTVEPNVNIDIPAVSIPATMCHEMGHQRGFAREDEANFIAFKACVNSPYLEFQYSGYYLGLQYLLSDLRRADKDVYNKVSLEISEPIRRDMDYGYYYWKVREGKAEEMATTLNDNYLKVNNQSSGVQSYNSVVKLILADYKKRSYLNEEWRNVVR